MGQMIKFEHNTLVLNNVFSKQDVAEIDRFAEYVRNQENERIAKLLAEMAKSTFAGDVWHINPFDYAIAIIKGEN